MSLSCAYCGTTLKTGFWTCRSCGKTSTPPKDDPISNILWTLFFIIVLIAGFGWTAVFGIVCFVAVIAGIFVMKKKSRPGSK